MMLHTSGLPQFAQVAECSKVRPPPLRRISSSLPLTRTTADTRKHLDSQVIEVRDGTEGFTEEIINSKLLG